MTTLYGYIAAIVLIVFLGAGWAHEHDKRIVFEAQVEQAGKDAAKHTAETDAKHREEMQNAEQNTIIATNSIADWYRAHPAVRVRYANTNCSAVPSTDNNPGIPDDSTASGYVSPYSPESTEQVASRLDQLQKLLRADGVRVE